MENIKTIFRESLKLRPTDRLLLIEMIARSLDEPDQEIDQIWAEEAENRCDDLEKDTVKTSFLNEVIEKYK